MSEETTTTKPPRAPSAGSTGYLPGYEVIYVVRNEVTDAGLRTIQERVEKIIDEFGGQVHLKEDWGKRKLAYPIKKETRGHYTYFVFTGRPGVIHELERNFRIHEHIIRFLSVNLAKEFDESKHLLKPSYMVKSKTENPKFDRPERGFGRDFREGREFREHREPREPREHREPRGGSHEY